MVGLDFLWTRLLVEYLFLVTPMFNTFRQLLFSVPFLLPIGHGLRHHNVTCLRCQFYIHHTLVTEFCCIRKITRHFHENTLEEIHLHFLSIYWMWHSRSMHSATSINIFSKYLVPDSTTWKSASCRKCGSVQYICCCSHKFAKYWNDLCL